MYDFSLTSQIQANAECQNMPCSTELLVPILANWSGLKV